MNWLERTARLVAFHEGYRGRPYRCTAKKLTIGFGYNIDDRGWSALERSIGRTVDRSDPFISREEAETVLRDDIERVVEQVKARLPQFDDLEPARRAAIVDFVFNIGTTRAATFRRALDAGRLATRQREPALRQACWDACAFHLMDSLWARQVDDGLGGRRGRADRVVGMIRTGTWPSDVRVA